jgi:hypothetical protein
MKLWRAGPAPSRRALSWRSSSSADGKTITVEVLDKRTDEFFSLDVAPELALDAFHHPSAYLGLVEASEEHRALVAA